MDHRSIELILFVLFLYAGNAFASNWQSPLIKQLNNNSALVYDHHGRTLFSHNANKLMVPASILKIATADAVITNLGEHYRIPTEIYLTPDNYLGIKGFGDPTLVSETLLKIAQQIKKYLKQSPSGALKGFWLDTSFFKAELTVHGQSASDNPYDASLGALAANFNTVNINKLRTGLISSAEAQTPLTATAIKTAKKLIAGKHRINLGKQTQRALQNFAELLQAFLKAEKIAIPVDIINKPIPPASKKIMTHYSAPVSEIIQTLFVYSNNFIANQLLIILGGEKKGAPADLEKGRQVVAEFLHNSVGINDFTLQEGSGLSRKNKITASEMMSLLIHFKPYHSLLRNYQNRFQAKTGTLRGISSFAGYMLSPSGETYPFVIMLNNPLRTSNRKEIANRIYNAMSW
ncbi:MAG: D-alanyl-D-alanine carboxypeptidase [Thiohalomonas sp.]|nr:D-alanyl-D-alanine carboxypeptidase [Thiohalomonas sp.]